VLLNIIEILFLFIVPIMLLYFKKINFKYRIHVLSLICLITIGIIVLEKWSLFALGIRIDNIKESLIPYIAFTTVGVLCLIMVAKLLKNKPEKAFYKQTHFIFGFVLVSILQEFLFRSFLIPKLSLITSSTIIIILINALLFTFMHIIYFNKKSILILLFVSGLIFAYLYLRFPNFILISISHSILNYFAVMFGFFSEENKKELD